MKKMFLTAAAIVLVIASALIVLPVMESESSNVQLFRGVASAEGDGN